MRDISVDQVAIATRQAIAAAPAANYAGST
jgi:hypothetical protein